MRSEAVVPSSLNFDVLSGRHKDAVYRQMLRVCGNHEDAEDVLVEALLKAHRHLDNLRDAAAFQAWLAQIGPCVCSQLKQKDALMPLLQFRICMTNGGMLHWLLSDRHKNY